jgi:ribonucleoside-diphosphate reductase beta chain
MQNQIHWLPEEVPMADDVKDWETLLTVEEKNLITQIFRFFVQADCDVSDSYADKFMRVFGKIPEIRMMLGAFGNMESVHMDAYSLLLDTLGMPEVEYQAFLQYEAMKNKHDFLAGFTVENPHEMAKSLAVVSGFIEGIQLFSSFVILLNFPRQNKLKNMGQIITWSVRDESLHVEGMSMLFKTFIQENRKIWNSKLKGDIYTACEDIVAQEDAFIDLAFEMGGVSGLTPEEVKLYIRFIADRRLLGLGLKPIFKIKKNPLPWVDHMLNGVEHANFFEARATEYSRAATQGTWDDTWAAFDTARISVVE